jgi:quercetin dioxygenase-like cupin family protein
MIRQGDSIENQVTGERLVFIKTSAETNGELVVVEAFVKPSGFVASPHPHPYQEERFEVLAGEVGFQLGKSRLIARPASVSASPPGHRTSSGTPATTRRRTSSARSSPRSSSSG